MQQLVSFLLTSCIVASAICVAIGWRYIRKGKVESHRKMMVTASVLASVFFILYVTKTLSFGSMQFGGPEGVKMAYLLFLFFHIVLATVAGVMGIITLYQAYKRNFAKHKRIGPWTSVIWFCTAFTGVMVYLLLYVFYPPGGTKSVSELLF